MSFCHCRYHVASTGAAPGASELPLSLVVFQLQGPGGPGGAELTAQALCQRFAADPESGGSCRGKLARHRPRELCLLSGTRAGSQAQLWSSVAPGSEPVPRLDGPIPLDFLAALDFFAVPRFVEVKSVRLSSLGLPLAAHWSPGTVGSLSLEWEQAQQVAEDGSPEQREPSEEPTQAEAGDEPEKEDVGLQLWGIIRARRKRWADETDSDDEGQKTKAEGEDRTGVLWCAVAGRSCLLTLTDLTSNAKHGCREDGA